MTTPDSSGAESPGFVEQFALAADRESALATLIPGTEEDFYYRCLHYQNEQRLDDVEALLPRWVQAHGESQRYQKILYRQVLLRYPERPQKSLQQLQEFLRIDFQHQRQAPDDQPKYPNQLEAELISSAHLTAPALRNGQLSKFTDAALDRLASERLQPQQRRELLTRLDRPDVAGLVDLVLNDLNYKDSRGFGSLSIHRRLLLPQLEECAKRQPELLQDRDFVLTYLQRLFPSADVDLANNVAARQEHLDRVAKFVLQLAPHFNSLKAHVVYHQLALEQQQGIYDKRRFLEYLALPRNVEYVAKELSNRYSKQDHTAELGQNFKAATACDVVENDEQLVRDFLAHFFRDETQFKSYQPFINLDYLQALFAETKLLYGLGDQAKWYPLLTPVQLREIRDRVELRLVPSNPTHFAVNETVQVEVDVKNVRDLLVNVYEINTLNYFRDHDKDVNTDIDLTGLVPNESFHLEYDEPPIRRERRRFEFPQLREPGVHVIDFIGNGRSSRVVVRKGQLRSLSRIVPEGQLVTILDAENQPLPHSQLWLEGRSFTANESGQVLVPFTTAPGRKSIVLAHNENASVANFEHHAESYRYAPAIFLQRESLLPHQDATVVVRNHLLLNNIPVSLKPLQQTKLIVSTTDLDNITTRQEFDLPVWSDRDSEIQFKVPSRLKHVRVDAFATVEIASTNSETVLSASEQFTLNGIDQTAQYDDVHLVKADGTYLLEALGKSGERMPHRKVQIELNHREFTDSVLVSLQTDERGQIKLGSLPGITSIHLRGSEESQRTWQLHNDQHSQYSRINAAVAEEIRIPVMTFATKPARNEFSLLEVRAGNFHSDHFDQLQLKDGYLVLASLPAGDYSLLLKRTQQRIMIHITKGSVFANHVLGTTRHLEQRNPTPLQISSVTTTDNSLKIQLSSVTPYTRVHVIASRFYPERDAFESFGRTRDAEPEITRISPRRSLYQSGRTLGDEERYILERQLTTRYPGNMLERPGLLLNPWELQATETNVQRARAGEDFAAAEDASAAEPSARTAAAPARGQREGVNNLDFLGVAPPVLTNLVPDEDGSLEIDLEALRHNRVVQIIAVDPVATAYRLVSLADSTRSYADLRLAKGLDPSRHFTRQKETLLLRDGDKFEIDDVGSARFSTFDSLQKVYNFLLSISNDEHLKEFNFVLDWPKLTDDEKRQKYSKYACHELNIFLAKKDPAFFDEVIRPYLENKYQKRFLDDWLIGSNLHHYLEPTAFEQLNIVERILLGKRLQQDREIARHVKDLLEQVKSDVSRIDYLFDSGIAGPSSELQDKFQIESRSGMMRGFAGGMGGGFAGDLPPSGETASSDRYAGPRQLSLRLKRKSPIVNDVDGEDTQGLGDDYFGDSITMEGLELPLEEKDRLGRFYLKLGATREWAENNYYHLSLDKHDASRVVANAFWRDFAEHTSADEPFYSTNLLAASSNFTEFMFALAVLDLPFENKDHDLTFDGPRMTLTAAGPMVILNEQVRPSQLTDDESPIQVSQNFYQRDDRHRQVNGQQRDKFVTGELQTHTVYGCQVAIGNGSSAPQQVEVLVQIPVGAVPVKQAKYINTVTREIEPYQTATLEFEFYFPAPGDFSHFPVHVSRDRQLLAYAAPSTLNVVDQKSEVDIHSWTYVSQQGSNEQVLRFLDEQNPHQYDLSQIAFRMQDKRFALRVFDQLRKRHVFNDTLWSYGIRHNLPAVVAEYLRHNPAFLQTVGGPIECELLTVDPIERRWFEHLEYKPLVNARAHQLGAERQILNPRLRAQYERLLSLLSHRRNLTSDDALAVTYYLLLQGRVEEAMEHFAKVDPREIDSNLQYDYFAAYLDCFHLEPQLAPQIVQQYASYPIEKWNHAFAAIGAMLDELNGETVTPIDPRDRSQSQTELADQEPSFSFEISGTSVSVSTRNLSELQVSYYQVNLESLFSRKPFGQDVSGHYSHIRPNKSEMHAVTTTDDSLNRGTAKFSIPAEMVNQNVIVEIRSGGKTDAKTYTAATLDVQLAENQGQLQVTDATSNRPLPKVYVKVYGEYANGMSRFYKDGYTDLRGRFDYVSLNTNELEQIERFAVLVISEEQGAVIREVKPPAR